MLRARQPVSHGSGSACSSEMSATVWRSARLIYRAPDASDEDFLYQMSQDSESFTQATPFLPKPPSQDAAKESRDWISKCFLGVLICLPMTKPAAAVDSKDDAVVNEEQNTKKQEKEKAAAKPKPVGFVVLMQPNPQLAHHRHAEIGITLDSEYHGKGYGSEAIEWILNWGFRFGALHRISMSAYPILALLQRLC